MYFIKVYLKTKNLKIKILYIILKFCYPTAKCYKRHVLIIFSSCQNLFNLEILKLLGY